MTTPVALGTDVATVATFLAVALLAFRDRGRPGALPFVALAVFLAAMAGGVAVDSSGIVPRAWTPFTLFVPFVFASLAWLALAFEYTGRGPVVTPRRGVALAAYGVAVVVITLLASVVPDAVAAAWILLVNAVQLILLTAVGYGVFLVARSAISYDDLPPSGTLALATAAVGLVAITVVLLLTPIVPYGTAFDVVRVLLAAIAVLLLLAQVRYRVFETGPSAGYLAREAVLDETAAAVAITGRSGQLLDFNRTAERAFDAARPDALGEPIEAAFGVDPDTEGKRVTVETEERRRQFEIDRSDLTGRGGVPVGRAYLLRDVTERRTRKQRIDVLNRVLRHNLRNDLDAIRGFAEALERGDADLDRGTLAAQIHATATDLAELGTTLARADRLLEADRSADEQVGVDALVRQVVATLGEAYPDATTTVSTPEEPVTVRTDRQVLELAIEETAENAVEHGDTGTPTVELAVRRDGSAVVIEVADDGPGIPERELSVLLDGEETPLRHGSGLGLWLVYWAATLLGGDLEFREREPRGSVVSLRIPDR